MRTSPVRALECTITHKHIDDIQGHTEEVGEQARIDRDNAALNVVMTRMQRIIRIAGIVHLSSALREILMLALQMKQVKARMRAGRSYDGPTEMIDLTGDDDA